MEDDEELFLPEEPPAPGAGTDKGWKVLVVDDEPDVHAITKLVLGDFTYCGGGLDILSAYSRTEAEECLRHHADLALVLLDVVMEETDAGLRLVRFLRDELGNTLVRIVLRTGQPGYAPERDVVVRYDINDYKEKTELTAQKLFTTVVASLRSYQHLAHLERQRAGLEKVVRANRALALHHDVADFGNGALAFLAALVGAEGGLLLRLAAGAPEILARLQRAPDLGPVLDLVMAHQGTAPVEAGDRILVPIPSRAGTPVFACLEGPSGSDGADGALLGILGETVGAGLDTVLLLGRLRDAQKAMVYALARMAEFRDADTGEHVRRVERLVKAIALRLRANGEFPALDDDDYLEQLTLASILHDVGKVGVPDAVLNKAGALDTKERGLMRAHAAIGARILEEAARMVPGMNYISLAAEIAANHHESADGSGYPGHKTLEQIPLAARIVCVADVYDALVSRRPYKEGWPIEAAIAWLREMAGQRFDPRIVEALAAVVARMKSHEELPAVEGPGQYEPGH